MARELHGGRPHSTHGRDRWRGPTGARSAAPRPAAERLDDAPRSAAERLPGAPLAPASRPKTPLVLRATRYGLPGAIILAGIGVMCFASTATAVVGGAAVVGAGLATALISWLYRIGVAGDAAREDEERARLYFEHFGRWPDERTRRPGR